MTDSTGRRSNSARATVRPPIPESKTPRGALFMNWNGDADTAGVRLDLQVWGEVAQVRRDVGFRTREEVIENPEHEPVLHLLALQILIRRVDGFEVVVLLLRLQRHHGRHAFPRHEYRAGALAAGDRLPPARNEEGAPEGSHRADAFGHGVCRQRHAS